MNHKNYAIIVSALITPMFFMNDIAAGQSADNKTRLIILADMGNEPDESQQMMHMLMYSNMFDLEGLIAVSNANRTKILPELFYPIIDGYGEVVENLKNHADGWPTVEYLHSIVAVGVGISNCVGIGEGNSTTGSKLIMESLTKDDPRPVYVVVNAGCNTLGQALYDLDKHKTDAEMNAMTSKIIVYQNGVQDDSGAWIMLRYPKIRWHRSRFQTYALGGPRNHKDKNWGGLGPYTWEPYERNNTGQLNWTHEHIQQNHGALGEKIQIGPVRIGTLYKYYPLKEVVQHPGLVWLTGGSFQLRICIGVAGEDAFPKDDIAVATTMTVNMSSLDTRI